MKPIKTAIVGLGKMGMRHLENLLMLPDSYEVIAVAEPGDVVTGAELSIKSTIEGNGIQCYRDYHDMMDAEKELEAVFVCTPHHLHEAVCVEALAYPFDVFLEKPVAPTLAACTRMLEAEKASDCNVAVGYHHMGHANAQYLKSMITSNWIGSILEVIVTVPWSRPNSYYERVDWAGKMKVGDQWCLDGVLMNQMSHFVNQAMWFAWSFSTDGLASLVDGSMECSLYKIHSTPSLEADDLAVLRCTLGIGTRLFCIGSTALETGEKETIEIIGSHGRVLYDGTAYVWPKKRSYMKWNNADEDYYMYKDFASMVRKDTIPFSPLNEATKATALLNAAYMAADFEVKDISGSDIGDLKSLMHKAAQYRCLFNELPDPPAWS